MKGILVYLILGVLMSVVGCSSTPELKPGQCNYNSDCKPGLRCMQGWCEDIYHPQGEIAPY